jgi:hypothetical protein
MIDTIRGLQSQCRPGGGPRSAVVYYSSASPGDCKARIVLKWSTEGVPFQ